MAHDHDLSAPCLLIAMPQLLDPFFHRSLVLLVHHDDEGSVGFIVNRSTAIKVTEILQGMEIVWEGHAEAMARFGGPVQPQLGTVLFDGPAPEGRPDNAVELLPGVSITQHVDDLEALAGHPPDRFGLLLGYAGWGEGQLLDEILRNDWLIAPVDPALVFASELEATWHSAIESVGIDPDTLPSWSPAGTGEEAN